MQRHSQGGEAVPGRFLSLQDFVSQVLCSHSKLRSVSFPPLHASPEQTPCGEASPASGSSCPQSVTGIGTVSAGLLFLQRSPLAWDKPDVDLRGSWQVTWGRSGFRSSASLGRARHAVGYGSSKPGPPWLPPGCWARACECPAFARQGLRPTRSLSPTRILFLHFLSYPTVVGFLCGDSDLFIFIFIFFNLIYWGDVG